MRFVLKYCEIFFIKILILKMFFVLLFCAFPICETASVKSAHKVEPPVFVVTPEPATSPSARNFPGFLPTPIPTYYSEEPVTTKNKQTNNLNKTANKKRNSTSDSPDLILAEFRAGSDKTKGKDRMLSVKEMLGKEKVIMRPVVSPLIIARTTTTEKPKMKVEDVWDIINHNDALENRQAGKIVKIKTNPETKLKTNYDSSKKNSSAKYSIETVPSITVEETEWPSEVPGIGTFVNKSGNSADRIATDNDDEGRKIQVPWTYTRDGRRQPAKVQYYPSYSTINDPYTNVDDAQLDLRPATGEAEDRFNPAKPYLPPSPVSPTDTFNPPKPRPPPPPVPMPPPPPPPPPPQPKPLIDPPAITYGSFPPSGYSYTKPVDAPPSDSYMSPPPAPEHDHSNHHDDHDYSGFKFELPPSDSPGGSGVDSYPSLAIPDDSHDHHQYDIDFQSLQDFYHDHHHDHHHDHPPPPPPPTTTTAAPEVEDERVNNRYSYYYLGKKLFYLPLYFSVYFIIYVGVLIIKSVARHKITYPQHWKTKRSAENPWALSDENLHTMTRFVSNSLYKVAEKYYENKL